jgi:antirestriction protein ArdC
MYVQAYERITERIITLLKQGTVPWHKPWKAQTGLPRNIVTKQPYRGINVFLLLSMSYESPFWLTFRQATILGGTVRKGETACPVVFWKQMPIDDMESGEARHIPLLRVYHVFNVTQCDCIGDASRSGESAEPVCTVGQPDQIVFKMPQKPLIKHGMTRAFYSPSEDVVGLPARERFERKEEYYSTLFHELIHATGHETRLRRATLTEKAGFGSDPYCKEELIAEMGAAFLCGHAGIADRTIDNSAAYLNAWLDRLERDSTLVVQAAAHAQKAADFVLGRIAGEPAAERETDVPPSSQAGVIV